MDMAQLQRFPGTRLVLGDVGVWVGAGASLGSVLSYRLSHPCRVCEEFEHGPVGLLCGER